MCPATSPDALQSPSQTFCLKNSLKGLGEVPESTLILSSTLVHIQALLQHMDNEHHFMESFIMGSRADHFLV